METQYQLTILRKEKKKKIELGLEKVEGFVQKVWGGLFFFLYYNFWRQLSRKSG